MNLCLELKLLNMKDIILAFLSLDDAPLLPFSDNIKEKEIMKNCP